VQCLDEVGRRLFEIHDTEPRDYLSPTFAGGSFEWHAGEADGSGRFDRAAGEEDRGRRDMFAPAREMVGGEVFCTRLVQDDPEGALLAVGKQKDNRAGKVGVSESGRGNKKPAGE
jgi:hypothetical protein